MRLQRDSYAPKSCAFDAANVQFLRAHLCKSHPVLQQERKSYNAHYQTSCLAPVLCFLNGWPIAVYNAAGTEDGRKVLEHQLERLIKIIKRAFPHHCILLRGDSGFNSRKIIKICEKQNICYVIGFSLNKKAQTLVAKQGLVNARRKEKQRYTTKGTAFRTLGELIDWL